MFKKTINFSQLKTDGNEISELKDNEVIQLLHRGHDVKVVMTQEHYFSLMAKAEENEPSKKRIVHNADSIREKFKVSKTAILDKLGSK